MSTGLSVPEISARAPATLLLRPTTLEEALAARAAHPEAVPVLGGTDLLVDLNKRRRRPAELLDLTRVAELRAVGPEDGRLRIGAGVTWTTLLSRPGGAPAALAAASRTVGSPQIRNRGTLGGNLGTASPAGDAHPVLLAVDATVELASVRGVRHVPVDAFFAGPRRHVGDPDELVTAVHVPAAAGPQAFSKVGPRNAMVIAVTALAVAVEPTTGRLRTGIGSAGPTPLRAPEAEELVTGAVAERGGWERRGALDPALADAFGAAVARAARPIDDVRGSADYRRHALAVLGRRALGWVWSEGGGA